MRYIPYSEVTCKGVEKEHPSDEQQCSLCIFSSISISLVVVFDVLTSVRTLYPNSIVKISCITLYIIFKSSHLHSVLWVFTYTVGTQPVVVHYGMFFVVLHYVFCIEHCVVIDNVTAGCSGEMK